jgi:hypothetical protein
MDRHGDDGKVSCVRGVNWAPDSTDEDEDSTLPRSCKTMDRHDDDGEVQYVRVVNWAPNSTDEDEYSMGDSEVQQEDEDSMAESEVQFVQDTYAGETEVPDTQIDIADVDEPDVEHALDSFASKYLSDKVRYEGRSLMLPVLLPRLYGDHDKDVHDAAVSLLWMSRGYTNV